MAKLDRIEGFRFWAHKIIPLVYDESLSYYEFLCKVMAKLNETIELLNKQNEELENFEEEIGQKFVELAEQFEEEMGVKFDELKDQLVSDINAYFALLIPTFSEDTVYLKGDYVYYNEHIYELTVPTITGEWDSTKWADVTLTESLASRLRAITDKLDDIDEDIAQLSQSLTTAINHLKYDIVSEYDTHSDYYEGDYVYHENVIYKANQYVTAGEFDSTKWGAVVLATDIATTLRTLKTYVDNTVSTAVAQLRSYVDTAVATAETELRTYTDGSVATAKAELKTYVDEQVAKLQLKKANLFVSKFTEVYYNENWVVNVTANQAQTFYSLVKFNQNCDFTLIRFSGNDETSLTFKQITNPTTGEILDKQPVINTIAPFTFYYFTNIPAGTWRFEDYNDGTNDYNFKSVEHAIQHNGATLPEQLYQYIAGLTSGELAYSIVRTKEDIGRVQNRVITLEDRHTRDKNAQQVINETLIEPYSDIITYQINALCWVDTEVNGTPYKGIYKCTQDNTTGDFDPQYWQSVYSVGSLIQQNLTALNGKKISDPMTQAQYDALTTVDPNTLYIIVPT